MCKFDHGVIFLYFSQNKVICERDKCSWILWRVLAQLMREKIKRMQFGSLIKSCESIIEITKKVQNLVRLTTLNVFISVFRVKNYIYKACE